MKDIVIAIERPDQPDVRRLLEAGDALSASLYPAESNHMLDVAALRDAAVTFLAARQAGVAIACGALGPQARRLCRDQAHVRRRASAGRGLGRRILAALEVIARAEAIAALKLETGIRQPAAIDLYRSAGFEVVPALRRLPARSVQRVHEQGAGVAAVRDPARIGEYPQPPDSAQIRLTRVSLAAARGVRLVPARQRIRRASVILGEPHFIQIAPKSA